MVISDFAPFSMRFSSSMMVYAVKQMQMCPFYPVAEPVVDWTYSEVKLVHPEGTFDEPKIGVVGNDLFCRERGVGVIALFPVPCCIGLVLLHVDADGHLAFHLEIFVVAPVVDVLLCQPAAGHKQAEEYLRAGVFAVLRETASAQVVLLCGLKIQRGHVIEADGYVVTDHLLNICLCH